MNLAEIKTAIAEGKKVFWSTSAYQVIKDSIGQYLIIYDRGGRHENCIGLTWQDGVTLNGKEDEFFVEGPRATIHNLDTETRYVVTNERQCRNSVDKSAYQEFVRSGEVITMGMVIVEKA